MPTAGVELYLPNRKTLQELYVPSELELPHGDPRLQVFDFGGPADVLGGVNPFETREQSWTFDKTLVVWAMTGSMNNRASPGAVVAAGFRFQIRQLHGQVEKLWFNKHQISANVLGSGALPALLRKTHLVPAGDTLTVEVKSLVTPTQGNVTRIQACLIGVIVPDDSLLLEGVQ
jgi:hypothetical protein